MRAVYLVRHPETDWNSQKRFQGRTSRPFTPAGMRAVRTAAKFLRGKRPDTVVTSPTHQALALARATGNGPPPDHGIVVDASWCEVDHGEWEGLSHAEVVRRFGPQTAGRFEDPEHYDGHAGETLTDVHRRVIGSWNRLLESGAGVAVVVSHATPIRLVLCRCFEMPASQLWRLPVDNAAVSRISLAGDSPAVDYWNRVPWS